MNRLAPRALPFSAKKPGCTADAIPLNVVVTVLAVVTSQSIRVILNGLGLDFPPSFNLMAEIASNGTVWFKLSD